MGCDLAEDLAHLLVDVRRLFFRTIRKAGNTRPAVIFIPRIDLAVEAAEKMRAIAPDFDVRVWLGRSQPGMV
jgi:hypothetical protein